MVKGKVKKHKEGSFLGMVHAHRKAINYIFLGVGLIMFALNITGFLSFVKDLSYDTFFFNLSVFSSMIIVLIAVYHIYENDM